jgi:adenylate cyclase
MHPEAFWRVVVGLLAEIFPDDVQVPYVPPGTLLRYLGPPETFPYISYYQVLQGDPSIPEDLFAGAMVLVGLNARTSADVLAGADQFATPFTMLDGRLMPGVEIHATQIENALMGQGILPVHWKWNLLAVSVPLLLALPLLLFWHPVRSTLLVLPVIAALLGLAYWLFHERFEWLATTAPLAALFVAYAGTGGGSYLIERRRAGEIRSAFSKYVSGKVVEEMIEHPERLTLGGQRREITVLFSDLAGFTTLSERLAPDAVGKLINVYLNAMTRIIMEHKGTVDKFIGDAVMAEWGAPLDDPQHAEHGVRAALAMQQRMAELQPQFREFGIEALHLRIGLNSGPAIVGNMGSDLLFDYTAMGDTVNLASRLEGVNKLYGTPILISAETASRLDGSIRLRHVDRIRVKGKDKPVDVFTPCEDPALVDSAERAFAAYAARDWPALGLRLAEIRALSPHDRIAAVLEERAAGFIANPPPPDWDGSVALDKY